MSEVGTAEHGDPAGMTHGPWKRLLPQAVTGLAGTGGARGAAPAVEMPRAPGTPGDWSSDQYAAFRFLHGQLAARFVLFAQARLPNRFDAEDVVHATFEEVMRIWPRVAAMKSPAGYVWRVLKSRIATLQRTGGRIVPVDDERLLAEDDRCAAGDPGTEVVNLMALQEVIRELPERQQEALVLESLGVPLKEVAELMGIKEESAQMNLKRARARLKRYLEAPGGRGLK
ncbi:RNA polymerase sigma factor [Streptomyces sp. NPDC056544]|uniref:RNA polymerase sigma factor n=1 Tax=unclassified Streptomyces TaxID=2593676 RepID=UPI0036C5B041